MYLMYYLNENGDRVYTIKVMQILNHVTTPSTVSYFER